MHIHGCIIFMQDGAPCHQSKVATELLKKNKIFMLEQSRSQSSQEPVDYY